LTWEARSGIGEMTNQYRGRLALAKEEGKQSRERLALAREEAKQNRGRLALVR
jgi:hypothetical protein